MGLGRFADLAVLRWDGHDGEGDYFQDHGSFLRFFAEKRKIQQYGGSWIDVAQRDRSDPGDFGGFSAVDELRRARVAMGATGPVLRRIWSRGGSRHLAPPFHEADYERVELRGLPRVMLYQDFASELRRCLEQYVGVSAEDAKDDTTHGLRAGASTSLVRARVLGHIIKQHAGVSPQSVDWIACYDRVDLDRRLACPHALGL